MSDQLIHWLADLKTFLPWVSFLAGIGGSFHCVGMCGGLVTASCDRQGDVVRYQSGRLIGYLLLGLVAGFIGSLFNFQNINPLFSLIPSFLVGGLFIYWGTEQFWKRKAEIKAPKFLSQLYVKLWSTLVQTNKNFTKSFFIGFISIFLPCGLLYGVVLGTISMQHSYEALTSMFFFWLGTVPSMIVAPQIVHRILKPLKAKLPKIYAISLMTIGVATIAFRVVKVHQIHGFSQNSQEVNSSTHKSCH